MNSKILIFLFLIVSFISCKNNPELKEVQITFAPSFLHPTQFTIDIKNKTLKQYTFQNSYYVNEQIDETSYKRHRKDTLVVHYQKVFSIDGQILNEFLKEVNTSGLDSTIERHEMMLDGIGYRISKITQENDTISLTSNITSRDQQSQLGYKILDPFFELAYQAINDYDGIAGLENIQDYFIYGLPIRKINDNPLEYRIWGSISGCREDNATFLDFLQNLPNNKPVLFDLRNGSIAYCLNEVLEEFSQKKELYLYGDKSAQSSKEIMDEIKNAEKDGEVLSELRIQAYETHKMIYENWINNQQIKSFLTKEETIKHINGEADDNKTDYDINIPEFGRFNLQSMKLDKTHQYGAGDSEGKIAKYISERETVVIDSSSYGEYGYTNTCYLLNNNVIQKVYQSEWQSLEANNNYIYVVTETVFDFKSLPPIQLKRADTIKEHFMASNQYPEPLSKTYDKVVIGNKNQNYWNKELMESWKREHNTDY